MKQKFLALVLTTLLCSLSFSSCKSDEKPAATVAPQPKVEMNEPNYKLYPTKNIWTYIKLNTENGRMWLVQYSVEGDESRFQVPLNSESLLAQGQKSVIGRFDLIQTSNMWNFILLDQVDGKQWQVQWSNDGKSNFVIPIN